jgi:hypothetical protein
MSKIKWVLTLIKTQTLTNGTKLETLESYDFDTLEDASDAEFRIDKVGIWDVESTVSTNAISYTSKGLQCIELFSLAEEEKG